MSRSHKNEIEIAAPPADVWRALSEGEALARWFATAAEVEAGVGGRWKVSWDDTPPAEYGRIETWEPGRRLSLVYLSTRDGEQQRLVQDIELEALDGGARTRVRVVASGFSSDASWDDEFEGTRNGWAVFLCNLRHYLELELHQAESGVTVGQAFVDVPMTPAEAYARLFGPAGLLARTDAPTEGQRLPLTGPLAGHEAIVDFPRAPALLGLNIPKLGLLRVEFLGRQHSYVHIMLLAHGEDAKARAQPVFTELATQLRSALQPKP